MDDQGLKSLVTALRGKEGSPGRAREAKGRPVGQNEAGDQKQEGGGWATGLDSSEVAFFLLGNLTVLPRLASNSWAKGDSLPQFLRYRDHRKAAERNWSFSNASYSVRPAGLQGWKRPISD